MARPSRPLLDERRIVTAALALIDEQGAPGFTLARLAARLGVKAASLYNHVSGKDDIVNRVRDAIVAGVDTSALAGEPWPVALGKWARSRRAAYAAHPNAVELFMATPISGPRTLRMYEDVTSALVAAGWPHGDALSAVVALENFVIGSALDLAAPQTMIYVGALGPDLPTLTIALAERERRGRRAEVVFDTGLTALLAGLRETRATGQTD